MTAFSAIRVPAALISLAVTLASGVVLARDPPPPTPSRKPSISDRGRTSREAAPETAGKAALPQGASSAKDAEDEPLPPPFTLPTASRARMRMCGEKWQAMKMAGETGTEIWRDFATKCLSDKD